MAKEVTYEFRFIGVNLLTLDLKVTSVNFSTFGSNKEKKYDFPCAICFAPLHSHYYTLEPGSSIVYKIKHLGWGVTDEMASWYHSELNKIGLVSEKEINNHNYSFRVAYAGKDNYILVLSTLVALRYLEENSMPKMIKWAFKYKDNANFWELFTLMHYTGNIANANHAFMGGLGVTSIYHTISSGARRMISLEQFHENIKTKSKEHFVGKGYGGSGISKVLAGELVLLSDKKKFSNLIKTGDIQQVKDILNEAPRI